MQVTPDEIGIDELYKVDSPYKATLQKSYEEFKKSKDYKDHKLTPGSISDGDASYSIF